MAKRKQKVGIQEWRIHGNPYFYKPDGSTGCAYCGKPQIECAREFSDFLRTASEEDKRRQAVAIVDPTGDVDSPCCGACGFWCHGCGRFWASEIEEEDYGVHHRAADGAKLTLDGEQARCVCGTKLCYDPTTVMPEEE